MQVPHPILLVHHCFQSTASQCCCPSACSSRSSSHPCHQIRLATVNAKQIDHLHGTHTTATTTGSNVRIIRAAFKPALSTCNDKHCYHSWNWVLMTVPGAEELSTRWLMQGSTALLTHKCWHSVSGMVGTALASSKPWCRRKSAVLGAQCLRLATHSER